MDLGRRKSVEPTEVCGDVCLSFLPGQSPRVGKEAPAERRGDVPRVPFGTLREEVLVRPGQLCQFVLMFGYLVM